MHNMAILQWRWRPAAPLVTGYSQNLAEAAGKIERGQRQVINLETHNPQGNLRPSFLASSVKGVFRSAAAWLVERVARQSGASNYITCDYSRDVPEKWRSQRKVSKNVALCPVCRVFGGSGCLGGDDVAPVTRFKSPVSFNFNRANDATYGSVRKSPPYRFAWEQIENKGKQLRVEQLNFEPDTVLEARLDPANDFAVALLVLSADLISSGFFRFGRFTSRGYGVVRLEPHKYYYGDLMLLMAQENISSLFVDVKGTGYQFKLSQEEQLPILVVQDVVKQFIREL
ncbi:MAG: hypothetical protein D6706_01475 [Chloroflexi bacterium]|nr:MAG: hypothetical protein D6706_01475 [Chloroflexota bacterium]